MTICIASLCQIFEDSVGIVFCADRLVSSEIKYEHNDPKIRIVDKRALIMLSGDICNCNLILYKDFFEEALRKNNVKEIAELVNTRIISLRENMINTKILSKYGITLKDFIEKTKNASESLIYSIKNEIESLFLDTSFIVAGMDKDGMPHIFIVDENGVQCQDSLGFAIIGSGLKLSLLEMTKEKGKQKASLSEALVKVYYSKKNAERTPLVGTLTDLGIIQAIIPEKTSDEQPEFEIKLINIEQDIKRILDSEMKQIQKTEEDIKGKISKKVNKILYKAEPHKDKPN